MTDKRAFCLTAGIFCVALSVALIQNLKPTSLSLASLFDSNAYMMCTQYLIDAVRKVATGACSAEIAAKSLVETIMLNGPILPGLGALYFTLLGKTPSLIDMRAPIVLQAVLHALASATLALAGWRMLGKKPIGLIGGLLFALYPAAILGAGRFLSETISTLAIAANMAACGFLLKDRESINSKGSLQISSFSAFALGLTAALIILLKPALAPGIALELISVFGLLAAITRSTKAITKAATFSVIGLALTFSPWLLYTQIATGHLHLTPQRNPTFNIAAGLNPETDGWSALPETPLVGMFAETDGAAAVAYSMFKLDQSDFFSRMMRKPARLFQYPWNDTRFNLLGIGGLAFQIIWHQGLISLAFLGMLFFLSQPLKVRDTSQESNSNASQNFQLVCSASFILVCAHLTYLPFVANSRYGFTAMPCLFLFSTLYIANLCETRRKAAFLYTCFSVALLMAAYSFNDLFIRSLFSSSVKTIWFAQILLSVLFVSGSGLAAAKAIFGKFQSLTRSQILAVSTFVIVLTTSAVASCASRDRTFDFQATLEPGVQLSRTIALPHQFESFDTANVLVNLRGDWKNANLLVNGKLIESAPTSLLHLNGTPELANAYKTFCAIYAQNTSGLDQWRAFNIPLDVLKFGSENTLTIEGSNCSLTGSTTGDTNSEGRIYGPSMTIFSPTRLTNDLLSTDARLREVLPVSASTTKSSRQVKNEPASADLSVSPGIQNGQFHLFLLLGEKQKPSRAASEQEITAPPLVVHLTEKPPSRSKKVSDSDSYVRVGTIPAAALTGTHVKFRLSGEVDSSAPLNVNIELTDQHLLASPTDLATYPSTIKGTGKRSFSVSAVAQSNLFDSRFTSTMIRISSNRVPLSVSQVRLEVSPLQTPLSLNRGQRWF